MSPGTVYIHPDYFFEDDTSKLKLFVVLNNPKDDEDYLVCITTSQPVSLGKTRKINGDCFTSDGYFYIAQNIPFKKKTWLLFNRLNLQYIPKHNLDFMLKDKQIWLCKPDRIEEDIFYKIITCIVQSDDLEKKHIKSIQLVKY